MAGKTGEIINITDPGAALTTQQLEAVPLVAEGVLTDVQIALRVGIDRRTLARWKRRESFEQAVADLRQAAYSALRKHGIGNRDVRLLHYADQMQRLFRIRDERAADPQYQDVPGWTTGLLKVEVKGVGYAKDMQIVTQFDIDRAWLQEFRAINELASREMGQWQDKTETKHDVVIRQIVGINSDDL
jgi:hypothetical protein